MDTVAASFCSSAGRAGCPSSRREPRYLGPSQDRCPGRGPGGGGQARHLHRGLEDGDPRPLRQCWHGSRETSSSSRARSSPFSRNAERESMSFDPLLEELAARRRAALKMGSEKRLAERAAAGILNARQRIEYLLDAGSFRELGLLSTAIRPEVRNKCPADGKISGFGSIADRPLALVSNDFTSLGASSSVVNGKKIRHAKELATRHGMPLILLGESSGARLPDRMGAQGRATMGSDPAEYLRERTTPWLSALLGSCYGSSTWYACLSDIVVMRKGATMSVASGRVTKVAVGQPV